MNCRTFPNLSGCVHQQGQDIWKKKSLKRTLTGLRKIMQWYILMTITEEDLTCPGGWSSRQSQERTYGCISKGTPSLPLKYIIKKQKTQKKESAGNMKDCARGSI